MTRAQNSVRRILSVSALGIVTLAVTIAWMMAAQAPAAMLLTVMRDEAAGPVLAFIDPASGKIVDRVPTGPDPHGVTVSDDGRVAFVANTNGHGKTIPGGDSISVIDVALRREIRRVEVGQGSIPHDVHFVRGKVYFSASGFKAVGRYDHARNRVEYFGLGQGGPHMLTVNGDATMIFAANNRSDNVAVIEGAGPPDWKVTLIPVGRAPEGTDISPDARHVWTVNEESGNVSIIDVATKRVAETLNLETDHANRLKFTPDGKYAIVLDREIAEVVVVEAMTRRVATRIRMPSEKTGDISLGDLVVLPDASRAYITVQSDASYIADLDLKMLTISRRIELPSRADGLAWAAPRASGATN
jgi:YVTN family beta-propeller protein